jgi:subtilisin family serine protease
MPTSHQSHSLRASRTLLQAGRGPCANAKVAGVGLICLLLASFTYAAGQAGAPTPPPVPEVSPVISGSYPADLDGNRIDDALEAATEAQGELSIAAQEMVTVEMIFREPITQRQIDEFLRLGGQVTYIYQAISYGWNGQIPSENVKLLPSAMGVSLVQVEAVQQFRRYMDTATQTGRVRPVWKAGFAGSPNGFSGDAGTTIACVGDGIDGTHKDLKGRNVYWKDFSEDQESSPVDFDGHGTLVAAVASGTGEAGGTDAGELLFTYADFYAFYGHAVEPIWLPTGPVTLKSEASWTGGTATLLHSAWARGTESTGLRVIGNYGKGASPRTLTNSFTASGQEIVNIVLMDADTQKDLDNVVIVNSVNPYPSVGDGFNKFRGVAPGCKWAAAKVYDRDGYASSSQFTAAIDDLVLVRKTKNIKVMNISHGLDLIGLPMESTSLRDKVNTVVKNGIVVVAAAGNGANDSPEAFRKMADPARAAQAITVGATNDENILTEYSTYGFFSPRTNLGEDYKPDLVAPGGSFSYTAIMSADSGTSDGINADKQPDDYAAGVGTSFSAPFVAGSVALVIQAMEQQGTKWKYDSADQPEYVKMLLCATANETNAKREGPDNNLNPTLDRAAGGPNSFPPGKDQHEGYGLINPDAAVEAVCQTYAAGSTVTAELGGNAYAKRVWARTIQLKAGCDIDIFLDNPAGADFDLYLYSTVPSDTGTPVILASGTLVDKGADESLRYVPTANAAALLVVKRISGTGTFTLSSTQAGPPTAVDAQASCAFNASTTITLKATDDGKPNPPGALSYTILSKPAHGRLELPNGTAIATVPVKLPEDKVVYKPTANYLGQDSFTFCADDGGTAPFGGKSNTATVKITVVKEVTVELQVNGSTDDVFSLKGSTTQTLTSMWLGVGLHLAGMRFNGVAIPPGSTINRASLKICAHPNGLQADVDGLLVGEAVDNAATFGESSHVIAQVTTITASTAWKWSQSQPWTANEWYESPDIGAIIQAIVNRPGWAANNSLVILYTINQVTFADERRFWSFDGDPAKAPKLVITYQPK